MNSCCTFTGALSEAQACPYCNKERYDMHGHPHQIFQYLPFTPHLSALFNNQKSSKLMQYRATYRSEDGELSDIFDGSHYCHLWTRKVLVDGVPYDHRFFSNEHNVALGIMMDGFQIFKWQRGGMQTCWPIIAINFNLPPTIRTHLTNIIPLAIIPGLKAPIDFNSYFCPFIDEAKLLASTGVPAMDAIDDHSFTLHVYLVSCHGDMPAIKHCMHFKGHNGIRPCRACEIKVIRNTSKPFTPHYVPLRQPYQPGQGTSEWPANNLPLWSAGWIAQQLDEIQSALTKTAKKGAQMRWGINGRCDLIEIPSLSLTASFPHEWMHLFLENHGKNLVALWTGQYKNMDEGKESYAIPRPVWDLIGKETAAAGSTIPSSFGRCTPNIATELHLFTAEDWGFWFVEIAPHVLKYRFPQKSSTRTPWNSTTSSDRHQNSHWLRTMLRTYKSELLTMFRNMRSMSSCVLSPILLMGSPYQFHSTNCTTSTIWSGLHYARSRFMLYFTLPISLKMAHVVITGLLWWSVGVDHCYRPSNQRPNHLFALLCSSSIWCSWMWSRHNMTLVTAYHSYHLATAWKYATMNVCTDQLRFCCD